MKVYILIREYENRSHTKIQAVFASKDAATWKMKFLNALSYIDPCSFSVVEHEVTE